MKHIYTAVSDSNQHSIMDSKCWSFGSF